MRAASASPVWPTSHPTPATVTARTRELGPQASVRGRGPLLARFVLDGLLGAAGCPHRLLRGPSREHQPVRVDGDEDGRGGVDSPERDVGAARGGQHHPDEADQRQRLDDVGHRGRRVLEVHPAVGEVGDGEERRLGRDPAEGVGDREPGVARGRPRDRGDQAGQGRGRPEQHRSCERLADAGAVGDLVDDAGEADTGGQQHRGAGEQGDRRAARPATPTGSRRDGAVRVGAGWPRRPPPGVAAPSRRYRRAPPRRDPRPAASIDETGPMDADAPPALPALLVLDVNETLSDLAPLAARFEDVGLPGHLAGPVVPRDAARRDGADRHGRQPRVRRPRSGHVPRARRRPPRRPRRPRRGGRARPVGVHGAPAAPGRRAGAARAGGGRRPPRDLQRRLGGGGRGAAPARRGRGRRRAGPLLRRRAGLEAVGVRVPVGPGHVRRDGAARR